MPELVKPNPSAAEVICRHPTALGALTLVGVVGESQTLVSTPKITISQAFFEDSGQTKTKQRRPEPVDGFGTITQQLDAYFTGEAQEFTISVAPDGTPFQMTVWEALREIPHGTTTSYQAIAQRLGKPSAARAVGAAVGKNPIAILIPCHRVVGTGGALTGFAWGLERKRYLLDLETRGLF